MKWETVITMALNQDNCYLLCLEARERYEKAEGETILEMMNRAYQSREIEDRPYFPYCDYCVLSGRKQEHLSLWAELGFRNICRTDNKGYSLSERRFWLRQRLHLLNGAY